MNSKINWGTTIFYAVTIWYIIVLVISGINPQVDHLQILILGNLFGISFLGSKAKELFKKICRILLMLANISIGISLVTPEVARIFFIPISDILVCAVAVLFFSQIRVNMPRKSFAKKVINNDWKCVLLIDDDESHLKLVRPLLVSKGFSVLTASTGEEGLRLAKERKPDLIFLDVILPGLKGRDVCRAIKDDERTKDIPIVFLTAKDSADDIKAEMAIGAVKHLTKPINVKILVDTVNEILNS